MRYQKGSISLNERRDKPILNLIADSRYVTHTQLWELSQRVYAVFDRRVFNWRLQRFVRTSLVRKQVVPFLNGEALYSISGRGLQALERLDVYYLGGGLDREKELHEFQIPHALELNDVRLALMQTLTLSQWMPESFIRVLNTSPATAYAKVYDGIARIDRGPGRDSIQFAIEYERTLKSQTKYEKIRAAIESEKRLNVFLYLMPTYQVLSTVQSQFWRTKRLVYFGLVDEFKKNAFNAPLTTAMFKKTCLWDALEEGAALPEVRT
jgi:hypothetical protein